MAGASAASSMATDRGTGDQGPGPRGSLPVVVGQWLWRLPRLLLIGVVRVYQGAISPLLGPSCRFTPTCSQYAVQALSRYGAVRGSILAAWRILRCHPWGGHGFDPPRWFGETPDRRAGETEAPADRNADATERV